MKLVVPSLKYVTQFTCFCDDFLKNDPQNAEYYVQSNMHFTEYTQSLLDEAKGINLQEGYVPCNHFWLVNSDSVIVGVIRIRHHIDNEFLSLEGGHIGYDIAPSYRGRGNGKLMLKLALVKAKQLGMAKVLLTADEDNLASRKVIEANGGEFEKIVMGKVFPNPLSRYWISCQ